MEEIDLKSLRLRDIGALVAVAYLTVPEEDPQKRHERFACSLWDVSEPYNEMQIRAFGCAPLKKINSLFAAYGLKKDTVRHALTQAVNTGLIERYPGDGFYITTPAGLDLLGGGMGIMALQRARGNLSDPWVRFILGLGKEMPTGSARAKLAVRLFTDCPEIYPELLLEHKVVNSLGAVAVSGLRDGYRASWIRLADGRVYDISRPDPLVENPKRYMEVTKDRPRFVLDLTLEGELLERVSAILGQPGGAIRLEDLPFVASVLADYPDLLDEFKAVLEANALSGVLASTEEQK